MSYEQQTNGKSYIPVKFDEFTKTGFAATKTSAHTAQVTDSRRTSAQTLRKKYDERTLHTKTSLSLSCKCHVRHTARSNGSQRISKKMTTRLHACTQNVAKKYNACEDSYTQSTNDVSSKILCPQMVVTTSYALSVRRQPLLLSSFTSKHFFHTQGEHIVAQDTLQRMPACQTNRTSRQRCYTNV